MGHRGDRATTRAAVRSGRLACRQAFRSLPPPSPFGERRGANIRPPTKRNKKKPFLHQVLSSLSSCLLVSLSASRCLCGMKFWLWLKVSQQVLATGVFLPRQRYRTHSAVEVRMRPVSGPHEKPYTRSGCGTQFEASAKDSLGKCARCRAHLGPPLLKN